MIGKWYCINGGIIAIEDDFFKVGDCIEVDKISADYCRFKFNNKEEFYLIQKTIRTYFITAAEWRDKQIDSILDEL
jgi:hypothetical protein